MTLDPHAQALLQAMAALPAPDFTTLAAADYRAMTGSGGLLAPGDAVAHSEDREIAGPGGPLRLRLYYPDAPGPLPLTLFLHGGGFVACGLDTHDNICRCLAVRAQTLVVSVDYRLAPEAPFPAAVQDAVAALEWLRAHAGEIGGDAQRIAVAGDSAGGNLAAVLAQQAKVRGWPLRHQLLLYPVTDCAEESASYAACGTGYLLTAEMMRWFRSLYLSGGGDAADPRASPLRAKDFGGLAPATIVTAEYDPLRDEGEAYALSLRLAGVPAALHRWSGQIHGFISMLGAIPAAEDTLDLAAAALRRAFAAQGR
ncbi:alpha/beta hydrolase [Solimonas sp. K1W22B-7]|uniref:alpha/beta hydrolase n=1 Tax=Solimonas sp. K1W22B-7 TaxID=2303331 RepID=UPI000E337DF7|nr:alpha/beta hydrolase [Solimonas sp. K1W22B-7]AXQ28324.1 alpha/beta hydrolase [Solimonas sp. K1W22B-7]